MKRGSLIWILILALKIPLLSQDYDFSLWARDTLYLFEPNKAYYDTVFLENRGNLDDVYGLILIADSLPPEWGSGICLGDGPCRPPGYEVFDTLGAGEIDSTITIDLLAPPDSSGLPAFVFLKVRSLGDPSLKKDLRIWVYPTSSTKESQYSSFDKVSVPTFLTKESFENFLKRNNLGSFKIFSLNGMGVLSSQMGDKFSLNRGAYIVIFLDREQKVLKKSKVIILW